MKRIISVVLIAFLIVASLPAFAFSSKASEIPDGLTYRLFKDYVCITGYTGNKEFLEIPSEIEGIPVTMIGSNTFENNSIITDVVIPDTVESLSSFSFSNCENLASITWPKSLKRIHPYAFFKTPASFQIFYDGSEEDWGNVVYASNNEALETVEIFYNWSSLVYNDFIYQINNGKITISRYNGKNSVVTIPSEIDGYPVTHIAKKAFIDKNGIKELYIPSTVTKIDTDAFKNCTGISKLYIENIESWCQIEFKNQSSNPMLNARELYVNSEIPSYIIIPETVKSIKAYAFCNKYCLKAIYIHKNVESIGEGAFFNHNGNIYYTGTTAEWNDTIQGSVFLYDDWFDRYETTSILYCDVKEITEEGFVYKIPESNTKAYILDVFSNVFAITIPSELEGLPIGISASEFYGSKNLQTVYFNGSKKEFSKIFSSSSLYSDFNYEVEYNYIPVEGLAPAAGMENMTIEIGESFNLEFDRYPEDANGVFSYSYSGDCITVSNGKVTGKKGGVATVTVTAESGVYCTFNVKVIGCMGIAVQSLPAKVNYGLRQSFDPAGLVVAKEYNDGSFVELESTEYTLSGYNALQKGIQTITVKWGGYVTEFDIFVSGATAGDINLDGALTAVDSNYMKRILAGKITPAKENTDEFFVCDINGDGQINALDASLLKRCLAGK